MASLHTGFWKHTNIITDLKPLYVSSAGWAWIVWHQKLCQPVTQSLVSLSDSVKMVSLSDTVKIQFDRQSKQQMRGKTHQPGHSSAPGDHHRGWWGGWGGSCNCKHLGTGLGNTGGQSPILYFCIWDVLEDNSMVSLQPLKLAGKAWKLWMPDSS